MKTMQSLFIVKESIGWMATAAFAASYLFKTSSALRRTQAMAAILWISYGVAMGSLPVIIANTVVAFMAVIYPWLRRAIREPSGQALATPTGFIEVPKILDGPNRENLRAIRG